MRRMHWTQVVGSERIRALQRVASGNDRREAEAALPTNDVMPGGAIGVDCGECDRAAGEQIKNGRDTGVRIGDAGLASIAWVAAKTAKKRRPHQVAALGSFIHNNVTRGYRHGCKSACAGPAGAGR